MQCENPDQVIPGQAWPVLKLVARGHGYWGQTIDVHARGQGPEEAHDGVPVHFDHTP